MEEGCTVRPGPFSNHSLPVREAFDFPAAAGVFGRRIDRRGTIKTLATVPCLRATNTPTLLLDCGTLATKIVISRLSSGNA
jgi:hypothetical protein